MDWLIFKTDIASSQQVQSLNLLMEAFTDVKDWTIDLEDNDHVFRVLPSFKFNHESHVVRLLSRHGFQIEPLEN